MRNPTVKEVADEIERLALGSGVSLQKQIQVTVDKMRSGSLVDLYGYVVSKTGEATVFHCVVPVEEIVGVYASTGEVIIRVDPPLTGARLYPTLSLARLRASHRIAQRMEKLRKHSRAVGQLTTNQIDTLKLPQ
ncbi:hypothetical protein [Vibrio phage VP06]|nr:hypothetical protein [Vibrio phage VP06]